jgi:putative ABC transport system permease protein
MFRNYFAAALRNLMRNKLVSCINIAGLAVGIATALLIGLYLRYELYFDDSLPGERQVYRLSLTVQRPDSPAEIWDTADPYMAEFLKMDYPEVALSARLGAGWSNVRRADVAFQEQLFFADPDFFRMLPYPAVAGDLAAALDSPDGLVITRSTARKYFGDENPLGQSLQLRMGPSVDMGPSLDVSVRVLAVIEDLPGNTHFNFRLIASGKASFAPQRYFDTQRDATRSFAPAAHTYFGAHTYFRLREGATVARIKADAQNFFERHYPRSLWATVKLDIRPIASVHLSPPGRLAMSPAMNPRTLWTLGLVGLLVLLLAAINFVNLMTARAAQRAIEVGVRKSAGARRADLIAQFLGEASLYVFAAAFLAVAMVELALPTFNAMLSTGDPRYQAMSVTFQYWREPALAIALLLAALVLSVLAGAYPAFVMSAMHPANALQRGNAAPGTARVRQILVVLQLATLIALIIDTGVIHRQTTFAMGEGLRIDRDQVLLLNFQEQPVNTAFTDAIAAIPGVSAVTAASALPTNQDPNASKFSHSPDSEPVLIQISAIDFNFFEFYRLSPVAGRLPSRDRGTDLFVFDDAQRHSSVWVNESAVRALGMTSPANAIGEQLKTFWGPTVAPPASLTIAGVVPDFPSDSVRTQIQPALYIVEQNYLSTVSIRLTGKQVPETLNAIDDVWKKLGEPRAVSRWFLDAYYQRMYLDIIQQRLLLGTLCGLAVFLACLGLFGLSIYTAQRRTKEIGIRKVMGARSSDIMRLLLWAFSKPVIWASLIAWPVAAWLMSRWLDGFVYRVDLGWWLLPTASMLALAITLATVSVHSVMVARAKPASALRYE